MGRVDKKDIDLPASSVSLADALERRISFRVGHCVVDWLKTAKQIDIT